VVADTPEHARHQCHANTVATRADSKARASMLPYALPTIVETASGEAVSGLFSWWARLDSNQGPTDYEFPDAVSSRLR